MWHGKMQDGFYATRTGKSIQDLHQTYRRTVHIDLTSVEGVTDWVAKPIKIKHSNYNFIANDVHVYPDEFQQARYT